MANALDQETRKLASTRVEPEKEQELLQATQRQLMEIQAERSQNLAVGRAESKASGEINQTLSQAAEIGAQVMAEPSQALETPVVNPATLGTLNKYGLGSPRFQKSSSHSSQVTKQNIVINNNTTTNTTNNVQVPANIGGPIQGRPLAFKTKPANDSTGKFKAWISSAFSRQSEESARRDREYRQRESYLSKSAGKMIRKLEEIGRTVSTRMDPRRIGTTVMSQIKTLLFVLGIGFMAQNWPKILGFVANIEAGFKRFLTYLGVGVKGKSEFHQKLVSLLGGNPQSENAFQALRRLIYNNDPQNPGMIQELGKYLSDKISERREAMKLVKFPDINLGDLPGTLKQIGGYLGDLLTAMVAGSEGVKNSISRQVERTAVSGSNQYIENKDELLRKTWDKKITDASGKEHKTDIGTMALFEKGENKFRGLTKRALSGDELDTSYGAEATVSQGLEISRLLQEAREGKKISTAQVSTGIRRLKTAADNEGMIPVSLDFINNILTPEERKQLGDKDITVRKYHVVARKKDAKDQSIENSDWREEAAEGYAKGAILDAIPYSRGFIAAKGGVEGAASQFFNPLPGSTISGGILGGAWGYIKTNPIVSATTEGFKGAYNNWTSNDYRLEVVKEPREGDIPTGQTQTVAEISPRVVQKIADKLSGIQDVKIDTGSQEFTEGIENSLVARRQNEIDKEIKKRDLENKLDYIGVGRRLKNNNEIEKLTAERKELDFGGGNKDLNISETYKDLKKLENLEEKHTEERVATESRREKAADEISQTAKSTIKKLGFSSDSEIKPVKARGGGGYASQEEINRRINVSMAYLQKKGLSKSAASGVVGNLLGEGLRLKNLGEEHPDGTGRNAGPSAGIAQFHSYYNGNKGELDFLKEYAARNNKDWTQLETQLDYLVDGSRDSKDTLEKIRKHTEGLNENDSISESTRIWGHDYERFAGYKDMNHETYKTRIGFGKGVYESSTGEKINVQLPESSSNYDYSSSSASTSTEEPRSLLQMFIDNLKSLVFGGGKILGKASEVVGGIGRSVKDKAVEALGGMKPAETYNGPITQEFTSYSEYKKNPGKLPPGMSYVQWGNQVFNMTGSSPLDLIPETISLKSLDKPAPLTEKEKLKKDYQENKISHQEYLEGLAKLYAIRPKDLDLSADEKGKSETNDKESKVSQESPLIEQKKSRQEYLDSLAKLIPWGSLDLPWYTSKKKEPLKKSRQEYLDSLAKLIPWNSLDLPWYTPEKKKEPSVVLPEISRQEYLEGLASNIYLNQDNQESPLIEQKKSRQEYLDSLVKLIPWDSLDLPWLQTEKKKEPSVVLPEISRQEYLEELASNQYSKKPQYLTYDEYFGEYFGKTSPLSKIMNLSNSEYTRLKKLYEEASEESHIIKALQGDKNIESENDVFAQKVASEYGVDIRKMIPTNKEFSDFLEKLGIDAKFKYQDQEDSPFDMNKELVFSETPRATTSVVETSGPQIPSIEKKDETNKTLGDLEEAISDNTEATIGQTRVEAKNIGIDLEPGDNVFTKLMTGELMKESGDPKLNILKTISENVGALVVGSNKIQAIQKVGVRTTAQVVDASRENTNATLQSTPIIAQAASKSQATPMSWENVMPQRQDFFGNFGSE